MNIAIVAIVAALALPSEAASSAAYAKQVATGDLESLEAVRIDIQRSIAVGGVDDGQVALWRYDWAYLNWRISHPPHEIDSKRRKQLLKEAEQQLDLILENDTENVEALALRGSVIGDRIEGSFSGALLGRRSGASHRMAVELEPDNPRAALLRGIGFYLVPKTFGGGGDAAEDELRRAVELFEARRSPGEWPNWGRVDALAWLGQVVRDRGDEEAARELFEQALALEPGNIWIRDGLLPALETARETSQ